MDRILDGLNDAQKQAVVDTEGCILTLAGAGSGKTKVLTHRIAYLIENGVGPWNILAVTFTNKAANEMKERITNLVGQQAKYIWVGTFHSICVRLLSMFGEDIGVGRNFTIIDDTEQDKVIKDCWTRMYDKPSREEADSVKFALSAWKNNLITPDEALHIVQTDKSKSIYSKEANVYIEYQKVLSDSNALDFDDIIMKAAHLLNASERAIDFVSNKFRYVLIDEYQDTNRAQYELIKAISSKHQNLFVVGDDAQSIYGWRFADIGNILNFKDDYSGKVYKLEQNYRSTKMILQAANSVISKNKSQLEKNLWTNNSAGDKLVFHVADNEYEEATMVANIIEGMIQYKKKSPSDFAILYRTNMQSRAMEESLIRRGIPYQIVSGTSFYERKEVKDVMAYLKVINNPKDSLSLARIINVPKRGIGDATVKKIQAYMLDKDCSLFEAMEAIEDVPGKIGKKTVDEIKKFTDMMHDLCNFASQPDRTSEQIIKAIWEATGYITELEASGKEEDLERADNLDQLLRIAAEYDEDDADNKLGNFLTHMSLVSDADNIDEDADIVKLMTVHSAKGLEFPIVFIIGMEDGTFPHGTAIAAGPDEVEEERRLFYVAITRAQEKLYITMATKRNPFGQDPDFLPRNRPSRFLADIPDNLMIRI